MLRGAADRVRLVEPEKMSILGLLMEGLLSNSLDDAQRYARACSLSGDVLVQAGEMSVTLRFEQQGLAIIRGDTGKSRARVAGSMGALLGVVTGDGVVRPFLGGRIRIGGNPFVLLRIVPLIQT